jgi:SAM-dependent methyltransferase
MAAPAGSRLQRWAASAVETAHDENVANIERLVPPAGDGAFVDLGCDDGALTVRIAERAGAGEIHGVEAVEERAQLATKRGVDVQIADLNERLPYDDDRFAIVFSNQVIEHLRDTTLFVREVHRVLRPGGHAIISTENLASWHNIFSLFAGWQPFSLTNVSHEHGGLGNPLALHRGEAFAWKSWEHVRVFAYRGLADLFRLNGFDVETTAGAGYFPLPARVGRWDPRHAAYITVKARKAETPAASRA